MSRTETTVVVSNPIPAGRRLCPTCHGRGVVGSGLDVTDPQEQESTDCPTCDPHDGRASLGHVAR